MPEPVTTALAALLDEQLARGFDVPSYLEFDEAQALDALDPDELRRQWTRANPPMQVRKIASTISISCCMAGVGCSHPPTPKPSRWRRARLQIASWWERRPRIHFGPCDHDDCGGW